MSVGGRVVQGGTILLAGQIIIRIVRVASLTVLGRLLMPSDYAIFALALVVTGLLNVVSDLQISAAIIRKKTISDRDFDTAFLVSFLRGLILAAILFFSAPWAAAWLGDARLEPVLQWLAINPLISAFWNPRFILYERDINFKAEFYISVASSLAGSALTVALGILLRNYWALIFGLLGTTVVTVIVPYFFVKYRPRFAVEGWYDFFSFGGWLTLANIVSYINYRSDIVLVGKFIGDVQLGYYSMGDRISQIATNELVQPFARAFYPGLVAVSSDAVRLRAAYYKAQQIVLAFVLPAGVATAVCAESLVSLMAGPKWLPSAIVVQILGPVMAISVMGSAVQALVMTTGDTRSIFMRNLLNMAVRVPAMFFGLWYAGLLGVIVARAFTGMVFTLSTLALAKHQTGDAFWQPFIYAWRSILSSFVMAVAMLAVGTVMPTPGEGTLDAAFDLAVMSIVAVPTYGLVHWLLWIGSGQPDGAERVLAQQGAGLLKRLVPQKIRLGGR